MKKRYGQHFISDRHILRRIVQFANVLPAHTVLEIGPGAGSLTLELATVAARVIAIEIDRDLVPALRSAMPSNVEIIESDALKIDLQSLAAGPVKVVGNFPYNVSTPLLKKFIADRKHVLDVTAMLQKEVAERARAKPGDADYGPLSVLLQYYANVSWGFTVPPGAFVPRPKVDSAVVRLEWKPGVEDASDFTDFVHRAFGARRKKLLNNLVTMFPKLTRERLAGSLESEGVSRDARAETLSVEQFLRVYNRIR